MFRFKLVFCRALHFIVFVSSLFVVVSSSVVSNGAESETRCDNVNAVISHVDEPDTEIICQGAAEAIGFLASIGVQQKALVEVNIVDVLPEGFPKAVGCYDWIEDGVFLLGTSVCFNDKDMPQAFRIPNDREVYKSYVAHEVAHAIAAQNFIFEKPSAASDEYIAGVVQLSVLDRERRSQILSKFPGDGYDSAIEINFLKYEFNPAHFAVETYRHYMKIDDGPRFIHGLLTGEVKLRDTPY